MRRPKLKISSTTYYETTEAAVQAGKEAMKLEIVNVLKRSGQALAVAAIAKQIRSSPTVVGEIVEEMKRTFTTHLSYKGLRKGSTKGGCAKIYVDLHPHLRIHYAAAS